jgi:hypothetical protein
LNFKQPTKKKAHKKVSFPFLSIDMFIISLF